MTEQKYRNPNIFQPDGGASPLDRGHIKAISIRCPHCQHLGVFAPITEGCQYNKILGREGNGVNTFLGALRTCPNAECGGIVYTIIGKDDSPVIFPPELIDFDSSDLPDKLVETLKEAISCHSVRAYRAAAMMVRRLLEEICDESQAKGADLHKRLKDLKSKITMPQELFDAMGELKALGNDAAHIVAKNYDQIGEDEAADSIELAKEILKSRYQLKGLVKRLKARKNRSG